ncbi:ABC transporter ATP-binding protein [Coraliomargarita sp. SDUM461004]|uniref:ABC transporter ATP-binding protein n=1 Tax=Thalassobacterium sedimentorum TaxID=3041258 RepID=A0ABU1ALT7_9BACT|nr:ABC transporter ATP-binding protein [Coraliomargarita sp. SDUM461004]MDQ8195748.1 ABC transporter ATP-binding protein [Coraliomargarita sp. SDUM461004]
MNTSTQHLLEAKALGKEFPGADQSIAVLTGVDFALRPGESVSIRGESGSGKSTLLNVLSGLERADAGQLFWQGQDVSRYSLSKLAAARTRFMGFVFQAYYLAPELNALENVLLGARIAGRVDATVRARAEALLVRVGLKERMKHASTKMSGGERQRVAVARALINDPPLVLADEPTGNLDESTGLAVMDLLLEIAGEAQKSLVLVTHNPDFAARTQRQLTLHWGQLA